MRRCYATLTALVFLAAATQAQSQSQGQKATPASGPWSASLQAAIETFEAGQQEQAMPILEDLLQDPSLPVPARSQARKYLALGHLLKNDTRHTEMAIGLFKDLLSEDPQFTMQDLALSYEDAPGDYAVRFFAQATLQWRQEELARRRARLQQTSRTGALMRSLVLPGLGQRYQGYRGRSWAMMGLAGAAVAYAVVADRSFRDARDAYEGAPVGADFEGLWQDYSDKANVADLALAVVGAVWALNLADAGLSGPNLAGLEKVAVAPLRSSPGHLQLTLRTEF